MNRERIDPSIIKRALDAYVRQGGGPDPLMIGESPDPQGYRSVRGDSREPHLYRSVFPRDCSGDS